MAIEDIFRALEEQADAECTEMLRHRRGAGRRRSSMRRARRRSASRQQKIDGCRGTRSGSRRRKTINAARLENSETLAAVREQRGRRCLRRARSSGSARCGASAEYERVFRALAEEAFAGVDGRVSSVQVDPADAAAGDEGRCRAGRPATRRDADARHGRRRSSSSTVGGRVTRRNTFEDRLDKVRTRGAGAKSRRSCSHERPPATQTRDEAPSRQGLRVLATPACAACVRVCSKQPFFDELDGGEGPERRHPDAHARPSTVPILRRRLLHGRDAGAGRRGAQGQHGAHVPQGARLRERRGDRAASTTLLGTVGPVQHQDHHPRQAHAACRRRRSSRA